MRSFRELEARLRKLEQRQGATPEHVRALAERMMAGELVIASEHGVDSGRMALAWAGAALEALHSRPCHPAFFVDGKLPVAFVEKRHALHEHLCAVWPRLWCQSSLDLAQTLVERVRALARPPAASCSP